MSVHKLNKKFKEIGLADPIKGSGGPVTATTDKNASEFEDFFALKNMSLKLLFSMREIFRKHDVSKSSGH